MVLGSYDVSVQGFWEEREKTVAEGREGLYNYELYK
jgi:hypothetical protein